MHIIDQYKFAVQFANERTQEKFKKRGPYVPGSAEHSYWLEMFDKAYV
jgi:hypothetical protein